MKLLLRAYKFNLIILTLAVSVMSYASSSNFHLIDKKAQKKWQHLINLQEDHDWLENQSEMGLYGAVFTKGWLNPKVERKIVPDRDQGHLVVDSVSIGPSLVTQFSTLTSNILLASYFPFVQGSPIKEKRFTNIRKVKTYRDALEAEHFKLRSIPLDAEGFNNMETGEIFTTISTSGFFTRYSLVMLDLLELALPGPMEFGPKAKLHIQKSIKITISKENDKSAIISLENINEKGFGIGTGLGIFFEDIIDLPISIGINGHDGYSPLVFNYKQSKQRTSHLIYKVDISTKAGENAYKKFLDGDFTALQDLAKDKESPVQQTLKKDGVIITKENAFGINLILWRSGFRNIHVDGRFESTLADGTKYRYAEEQITKMKDRSGFSGKEKEYIQYSTIVPLDETKKTGFVLDTTYFYQDSKTKGSELIKVSKKIKEIGMPQGIPVKFNKKKQYGETQIQTKIRFSASAMNYILTSYEEDIWEAIAISFGFADSYIWLNKELRQQYKEENENHSDLNKAIRIYNVFAKMNKKQSLHEKAQILLKNLKKGKTGRLLHKTMINIVGLGEVMGQGYIRGI
jgi:hypothetical protein